MKSILISIQPKWCELIANGQKTIEVRKTKPKIETPFKVYIYCTKPSKKYQTICGCTVLNSDKLYRHPTEGIKYGDSIELMCCHDDYSKDNFLNGKVIGEFVCDRIYEIGYDYFYPCGYEVSMGEISRKELYEKSCLSFNQMDNYLNMELGYGWHISDLVIYDKPKELSEFYHYCGENPKCEGCEARYYSNTECGKEDYCCSVIEGCKPITHPPKSWGYVESEEKNNA